MHAIVIGAGVAGPAFALFLRKAGLAVTVYEARPGVEGTGGGLGLAPNGMHVIAALGLAQALEARATIVRNQVMWGERGRRLARLAVDARRYGQPLMGLRRSDLHALLADEMHQRGVEVHYGKRLAAVQDHGDRVVAKFADGSHATGDILVGADGIHSLTRRTTFPDAPAPEFVGIVGVGGFVSASAVPLRREEREALHFTFGRRGFFGYGGARSGEVMWWSNLARPREMLLEELEDLSPGNAKTEMAAIFSCFHAPIPALVASIDAPLIRQNVFDMPHLPAWHRGRVALIGDAAHAVSPNTGQGASLALEDAMYLAKLLREVRGRHAEAFARFEAVRRPRVEAVVQEGRRQARNKQEVGPVAALARDAFLRVLFGLFGRRLLDRAYRYRIEP